MVKPTNTSAITKATNRPWDDWVAALDAAGAREMNHGDIAKQALKLMPEPVEQKDGGRKEWPLLMNNTLACAFRVSPAMAIFEPQPPRLLGTIKTQRFKLS